MITDEQRRNFSMTDLSDIPVPLGGDPLMPIWNPPVAMQDSLERDVWTQDRINKAKIDMHTVLGINDLIPPGKVERQSRLDTWWRDQGQGLPRYVLDELGVVGGERVPTIQELQQHDNMRQVGIVKEYLGIKKKDKFAYEDPLAAFVVADPSDVGEAPIAPPEMREILYRADDEDLKAMQDVISRNVLAFDDKASEAINDEIKIRDAVNNVIIPEMNERPLTVLIGTDFFNKIAFGLPEYTSRKGINPVESLLEKGGLAEKGDVTTVMRAAARVRSQLASEDPRLLTQIGLGAGDTLATLIHFAALPNPAKLKAFAQLPKAARAALGLGTKAGLLELVQAPEKGETFDERVESVALATGSGIVVGGIFSLALSGLSAIGKPIVAKMEAMNVEKLRKALIEKSPKLEPYLKTLSKDQLNNLRNAVNDSVNVEVGGMTQAGWDKAHKPFVTALAKDASEFMRNITPQRGIVPTGFRAGMAEIEGAGEAAKKLAAGAKEPLKGAAAKLVAAGVGKKAPEVPPAAITPEEGAARAKLAKAVAQPKQAPTVKPVKPKKILTKKEAFAFNQANMVTGEDVAVKIVTDPKVARSLKAEEKKIASLRTRLAQAQADKKVAVSREKDIGAAKKDVTVVKQIEAREKAIATEIAKRESSIAKLKERHAVKLETTIEGAKVRIAKMVAAKEFKEQLRSDAISLLQAIPKEMQPGFIKRATSVTTVKGIRKLATQVMEGLDKHERRIAIDDLKDTITSVTKGNNLGKVRLGKIPSPQRENLIELIDSVDVKALSEPKEKDLASLSRHVQRIAGELAGDLSALDADVEKAVLLPSKRIAELLRFAKSDVKDMSVDDIRLVADSIQLLAGQAKLKGQLLVKGGLKPLDKAVKKAQTEIAPSRAAKAEAKTDIVVTRKTGTQKVLGVTKKAVILDSAHLDTLVELSSYPGNRDTVTQILDSDLHKGFRKTAEKQEEWLRQSRERFTEIGLTREKLDQEFSVTLAGKKIKMKGSELVSLEMDMRSLDNLKSRLTAKGIVVGDKELVYPKGVEIDRLGEFADALASIRGDKALMGFADWIGELNQQQRDALNETFRVERGYEVARESNYYPRSRYRPKQVGGKRGDLSTPPEEQGRYLPRTGGTDSLRVIPADEVFLQGLESDAFTHGMTIPLRNARLLIGNRDFQKAMIDAGRKTELDNMILILKRLQGVTTSKTTMEMFSSRVRRGVVGSALGFRVSTIGTQAMSYPAAFAEINPKYARPMTPVSKDTIARIEEDSSLMALRWLGRRIGVEVGTSATVDAFDMLLLGSKGGLLNRGMAGLVVGDRFAIGNMYQHGVLGEIANEPRNGKNVDPFTWDGRNVADLPQMRTPGTREARYAAARRLEYVVRRTQPMFDMLDRSVSLSNPSSIERSMFMFRTALEAQENIGIRALDAYTKSNKTKKDTAKLAQGFASMAVSAFSVAVWKRGFKWALATGATAALAAFGIFKYKDPEVDGMPERIAKDTAKNVVRMNKFGKFAVDIGEKVANSITGDGYNWNRNTFEHPVLETLQSGGESVVAVSKAIADMGLLDEFVEETTPADIEFNQKLADKLVKDIGNAIRSSAEFGVRITGTPVLAPYQEFVKPFLRETKIPIIREVTYSDMESPGKFADRVHALYEQRKELQKKSKVTRLTPDEERNLSMLNTFVAKANKTTEVVREISDPQQRALRYSLFVMMMNIVEERVSE